MSEESTPVVEESTTTEEVSAEETQPEQSQQEAQQEEAAKVEMIRQLKLKIDGEEFDEELPFEVSPEHAEYLKKKLELASVAQKRMQQSAEYKKQNEQVQNEIKDFVLALREDPEAILADPNLGVDLKALAERIMAKELEEAAKPEEQKEKEALERKLQELEHAKAKLEEERLKQEKTIKMKELRAEEDRIAAQMQNEITEEIQNNGLPNDPEMLKLVASNMRAALRFGVNVSVREIVPFVKKELYENAKKQLASLSDDEIAEFIGSDRLNTIRKNMIKRLKSEVPSADQIKDQGKKEQEAENVFKKKNEEKISMKEWKKQLKQQYR
jgi:hypothetical protein